MSKILITSISAGVLFGGVLSVGTLHVQAADEIVEVSEVNTTDAVVSNEVIDTSNVLDTGVRTETGGETEEITTPEIPIDPPVIPETGGSGNETEGETGGTTTPEIPVTPPVVPETDGTGGSSGNNSGGTEQPVVTTPSTESKSQTETSSAAVNTTTSETSNQSPIHVSKGNNSGIPAVEQRDGKESSEEGTQSETDQLPKTGNTKIFDFLMFSISAIIGSMGMALMHLKRYIKKS